MERKLPREWKKMWRYLISLPPDIHQPWHQKKLHPSLDTDCSNYLKIIYNRSVIHIKSDPRLPEFILVPTQLLLLSPGWEASPFQVTLMYLVRKLIIYWDSSFFSSEVSHMGWNLKSSTLVLWLPTHDQSIFYQYGPWCRVLLCL